LGMLEGRTSNGAAVANWSREPELTVMFVAITLAIVLSCCAVAGSKWNQRGLRGKTYVFSGTMRTLKSKIYIRDHSSSSTEPCNSHSWSSKRKGSKKEFGAS
jgi:hypothetical protein